MRWRSETKEKKEKRGESRNWSGGGQSRLEMSGTGYDNWAGYAECLYVQYCMPGTQGTSGPSTGPSTTSNFDLALFFHAI